MNEHHRVVIAAAVAALLGKRARVRQIRALDYRVHSRWSRQGRAVLQSSHNPAVDHAWGRMPAREPRS